MADAAKYAPINNGTQITDLKSKFSLPNTNKTVVCAYTSVFFFIAFTIFLAFSSSSNSSSPWFSNIFTTTFTTSKNGSDQNGNDSRIARSSELNQEPSLVNNETKRDDLYSKDAVFINKTTTILPPKTPQVGNIGTVDNVNISTTKGSSNLTKNLDQDETLKANKTDTKQGIKDMVKALVKCNLYDGNWVKDESYPLYEPGSCLLIDEKFNCFSNGRPDHDYYKLKWKPKGCSLPRLNGTHMLELLRGKRLVYVGDSLNRNMWESLICILRNFVKDKNKVYEENGRAHFKGESSYSFIFEDYAFRVEFYTSPFLVRQWEVSEGGEKIETLRLDLIGQSSEKYKDADFIIFNTGHWWTHDKTSRGKDYYQEGSHVYNELDVLEAFRRAITTWARWVDSNVNSSKTHVMFRGYSASHFRGGQWNSGGQCDRETEPMKNERYLRPYPPKMAVLDKVLKNMKNHVSYLNVTRMTDYRKDGHPSVYRKQRSTDLQVQDCSHWCLPGVPDTWNELLYAELLRSHFQNGQY